MSDSLLIIEDEALLGNELARFFRKRDWDVTLTRNLEEAEATLSAETIDPLVVLSDMNLPDGNALDFLEKIKDKAHESEWIFVTGYGSVADSVRAVRLGAYDFIEKPCDPERLNLLVEGAARSARAQRRLSQQNQQQTNRYSVEALIGNSPITSTLRQMIWQMAQVPFSSLIISGETGTGKGLIARILHHTGSRAHAPLIELNCAALPKELLESELFGYEAGAFTGARKRHRGLFEQAHTGTLFLDEIGEMDLDLQTKLLKAVEDLRIRRLGGESEISIDVQIIAASNLDLSARVEQGLFRSDLYHRLNIMSLRVPSLEERKQDLDQLVPAFIAENNRKSNKNVKQISETAWAKIRSYNWPGNIRELSNVIERCVLLASDEQLPEHWLQLSQASSSQSEPAKMPEDGIFLPLDGSLSLQEIEKYVLQEVLNRTDENVTAAARMLGTTRQTLRYRIQKYNLRCKS